MLWFVTAFFHLVFCWQEQQQESVCFKASERTVRIVFGIPERWFFLVFLQGCGTFRPVPRVYSPQLLSKQFLECHVVYCVCVCFVL